MDYNPQIQLWCLGKDTMISESTLTYRMKKKVHRLLFHVWLWGNIQGKAVNWNAEEILFCYFPPSPLKKGSELICLIATVLLFWEIVMDQRNVVVGVNTEKNMQLC